MPSSTFTSIVKNPLLVLQLMKNSSPTLPAFDWKGYAPNNSATVRATKLSNNVGYALGGDANQTITGLADLPNVLEGGAGNDTIIGGKKDDFIYGGTGDDSLTGGDGSDRISGGAGNDRLFGNTGNDYLWGDDGNDYIEGGQDQDTITGGAGADMIYGDSSSILDKGDSDTIFAGDGNDTVFGGVGNDIVYGDNGNDILDGGVGDDTIVGGSGRDTLTGGDGNDAFVMQLSDIKSATGTPFADVITDFTIGSDKLWIQWNNYATTVTKSQPLIVSAVAATGGGTQLNFNFSSNGASTVDYSVILRNISVSSLGTGQTLTDNLNNIFIVYEPAKA